MIFRGAQNEVTTIATEECYNIDMRAPIFLNFVLLSLLTERIMSARKSEDRIVGGKIVEGDERPAFMAIFNFKPSSTVKCTASIISPYWLISAAHCLVDKKHFETYPCLQDIKKMGIDAVCEKQDDGDILVKFPLQVSHIRYTLGIPRLSKSV